MAGIDPYGGDEHSGPGLWFWAAAIFLGVVIVAAAAVLLIDGGDDEEASPAPPRSTEATETAGQPTEDAADEDTCADFPDASEEFPSSPPSIRWESIGPVTYPASDTAGPSPDSATCFAATPTGALFAAASGVAHVSTPDPSRTEYLQEALIGPGKSEVMGPPTWGDAQSGQVTGYRFAPASCDPNSCSIDLLVTITAPDTEAFARFPTEVRRDEGTWKLYVPGEGYANSGTVIDDPDSEGFVRW